MMRATLAAAALLGTAGIAILSGARRQAGEKARALARLYSGDTVEKSATVAFAELDILPAPVARYFRYALKNGQPLIRSARYRQAGTLRTDIHSKRWFDFEAVQHVVPGPRSFIWDARVFMLPLIQLGVADRYVSGRGSSKVDLLSIITIAQESGGAEMNSGSLHRYLAEAVWYPTALLPGSGVRWSPIDDRHALATLTDSGTTVQLEFAFAQSGEVTGIHTSGRWGKFKDGFRKVAWEGHFGQYAERHGMRIPLEGEVGWYDEDKWHAVRKGRAIDVAYQMN